MEIRVEGTGVHHLLDKWVSLGRIVLVECTLKESVLWNISGKYQYRKPIIISETEEIHKGDFHWNRGNMVNNAILDPFQKHKYRKVLALTEHISPESLEVMAAGIEDNDKVYVNLEEIENGPNSSIKMVAFNKAGHVILYKVDEKTIPISKVRALVFKAYNLRTEDKEPRSTESLNKWFDKNIEHIT